MNEDLSNAIMAYELANSNLSVALDRLTLIMRSGIDVHSATYAKCLERIKTVQATLTELHRELEQLKAERNHRMEE